MRVEFDAAPIVGRSHLAGRAAASQYLAVSQIGLGNVRSCPINMFDSIERLQRQNRTANARCTAKM